MDTLPEESGRNPFWPIGWNWAVKQTANSNEHVGPEILPTAFSLAPTSPIPAQFAIVNGKRMQEGTFGLQQGNQTYQITVKSIEDGRVVMMRRDQEIVVPLRRK